MKKEQKNEFLELRAGGMSYDKIAQKLGVSKQTLINWSKELEKRDLSEIPTLKLFDLFMKYYKLLDEESKGVSFRAVKVNRYGGTDKDYWYG